MCQASLPHELAVLGSLKLDFILLKKNLPAASSPWISHGVSVHLTLHSIFTEHFPVPNTVLGPGQTEMDKAGTVFPGILEARG